LEDSTRRDLPIQASLDMSTVSLIDIKAKRRDRGIARTLRENWFVKKAYSDAKSWWQFALLATSAERTLYRYTLNLLAHSLLVL
jgi:hypothetical protein